MKNCFQGPIQRPLVKILENPGTHVKHILILHLSAKFQISRVIHSRILATFKKKGICILYLSLKFQVSRFIHSKVLAIFGTNSFQDPIRPLVEISGNPGAHAQNFLVLHTSAKFQVSRLIHSKVLAIFKKKKFF